MKFKDPRSKFQEKEMESISWNLELGTWNLELLLI
jgi:hypothetical protein